MAITNSNIYKYISAVIVVFLLALVLTQGVAASEPAKECRVRADISADESRQLIGAAAAIPSGTRLSLEGAGFVAPGDSALLCTYGLIKFATQVVFILILALAVLLIAYAAFLFLTAGNNPEKQGKARNIFLFAIVGLLLAVLAKVIPTIVRSLIGV